jgi:hypothetical protein
LEEDYKRVIGRRLQKKKEVNPAVQYNSAKTDERIINYKSP